MVLKRFPQAMEECKGSGSTDTKSIYAGETLLVLRMSVKQVPALPAIPPPALQAVINIWLVQKQSLLSDLLQQMV